MNLAQGSYRVVVNVQFQIEQINVISPNDKNISLLLHFFQHIGSAVSLNTYAAPVRDLGIAVVRRLILEARQARLIKGIVHVGNLLQLSGIRPSLYYCS